MTIVSHIIEPLAIDYSTFWYNTYNTGTLYVPEGTKEKYQSTESWSLFQNIVEGEPTGVDKVTANGSNAKVVAKYTLDGKRVKKLQPSLNIFRMSDGTTKKAVVK